MKNLPNLYKNTAVTMKNHNKEYCYLKKEKQKEIKEEIENIIKNTNIYQIPLIITTKNNIFVTRIIKREKDKLITFKNEVINIKDILKIEN